MERDVIIKSSMTRVVTAQITNKCVIENYA